MKYIPTLSPRHACYVRDAIADRGADPAAIFEQIELDLSNEPEQIKPIPVATFSRLLDIAAHQLNDPYFGMHVAQGFHHESSGLMILTTLSAPTLEVGIKTLLRYDKQIDSGIDMALSIHADTFELSLSLIDPLNTEHSQLNEYLTALLLQLFRTATRQPLRANAVYFQHGTDRDPQPLADFFAAPLHFNAERNKLIFDNALLKEKFVTSHELLHSLLSKAMQSYFTSSSDDEHTFIDIVSREILKQTAKEAPSIENVASSLSMSVRSLRRHLSEEGYSFQDIKKVAKENQAKYFLAHTNMGQAEIAYELGYSEVSAFSRAFRSWTGETPQAYREKHQDLTDPH